jgi:hypothetical protein
MATDRLIEDKVRISEALLTPAHAKVNADFVSKKLGFFIDDVIASVNDKNDKTEN